MGKDYRTGLITGVVLAVAALIWVATRPSLNPRPQAVISPPDTARTPGAPDQAAPPTEVGPASETVQESLAGAPARQTGDERQGVQGSLPPSTAQDSSSVPQDLTIYEKSEPIKTTRFHIVRRGETLSSVAQQYYGSPNAWQKILAANKAVKDANKIAPGTKLIIPE